MQFVETSIGGVFLIEIEPRPDARGFFARTYCVDEFREHGLDPTIVQSSISYNAAVGTLRGLHFQTEPHGENKTIRCLSGALFVVAVDLRRDSASYLEHVSIELDSRDRRALYVPAGCATGYQTLQDHTEIMYDISTGHAPDHAHGIHHRDPGLAIDWPMPVSVISTRDAALPMLEMVPAGR